MFFCLLASVIPLTRLAAQGDPVPPAGTREREQEYVAPDCGMEALYILLNSEGRPVRIDDLRQALPPPRPTGYCMAELQRAALRLGQPLEGHRLDEDDFPLAKPVIVFIRFGTHGHFATLRPVGDSGSLIQISDPPHHPQVIDYEDLVRTRYWTGMVLVPASPRAQRMWRTLTLFAALGLGIAGVVTLARRRGSIRDILRLTSPSARQQSS